jgi:cytochrome c oxidase subunit 4
MADTHAPDAPDAHAHDGPTPWTYLKVAAILCIVTALEVWAYYIPALVSSPWFVPSLLIMAAVKFALVVMYYMHLKYDHRIFRALFSGPLAIAVTTGVALMFLFAKVALKF